MLRTTGIILNLYLNRSRFEGPSTLKANLRNVFPQGREIPLAFAPPLDGGGLPLLLPVGAEDCSRAGKVDFPTRLKTFL